MPAERRGQVIAVGIGATGNGRSPMINGRRQPSSDGTSRMTRECQVRICEGLEVQFLGPTRPAHPTAEWLAISSLKPVAGSKSLVLNQGPRSSLCRDFCPPGSVDRYSRPPDAFPLTLAKRLRRTVDRFNPEGMH